MAARLVATNQAFILDRVHALDGFRQISTIGLGVGFAGAAPVCSGDGLRRATVCGLRIRSIDNAMFNHDGRIVVVTDNAGAERADMRADCAIDMLNIGRRIVRHREHRGLGGADRGQDGARADEGGREAADQLT